jgi:uncharacterized membrane protein YjjP (DUF1212 family)
VAVNLSEVEGRWRFMGRAIIAVISTILGGILGSFLEPQAFANSIPIAIMGGFIISEVNRKNNK